MSFRLAEKQALKSPFLQHRVGAVVMKGKRVLSTGYNSIRWSSVTRRPTAHAEASAISKLLAAHRLEDLAGSTLFVTRFTRGGVISCARPCSECESLIRAVGIDKVYYTDFDGTTKEMIV
jgi:deoxycytidylate deaminase